MAKAPPAVLKATKVAPSHPKRNDREIRKELSGIEKSIARLDAQKKETQSQLMNAAGQAEALRLHNEVTELTTQLDAAEVRWCELQAELEEVD